MTEQHTTTRIAPADVWSMPLTGIGFACCCGSTPVTEDMVEAFILNVSGQHAAVTHAELADAARDLWMTGVRCRFFDDALDQAVCAVNGSVQDRYPWAHATAAIGLFSRTWPGCPVSAYDPERSC